MLPPPPLSPDQEYTTHDIICKKRRRAESMGTQNPDKMDPEKKVPAAHADAHTLHLAKKRQQKKKDTKKNA